MLVDISYGDDVAFSTVCREHHWKRTAQRRAVFNYLCGNRMHPSVETVWNGIKVNIPDVSLDSVYRILDAFAEAGIIRRLEGTKVIRYDADTQCHEHFVCTRCDRMLDLGSLDMSRVVEQGAELGRVDVVELTIHGVCHSCMARKV